MSQIVIEVGKQMDGTTFQLSPQTRAMLSSRSGERLPTSSIFVSGSRQTLGTMRDPMLSHIVALLTGASLQCSRRDFALYRNAWARWPVIPH